MKKILTTILAAALAGSVWGALSGSGTEADPYLISNEADLVYFGEHVGELATGYTKDMDRINYFKITGDIALLEEWTPISQLQQGSYTWKHVKLYANSLVTISGLKINAANINTGLFGKIGNSNKADFENICISGADVSLTCSNNDADLGVGAFVGWCETSGVTFKNCHVQNSNVGSAKNSGGMIGFIDYGPVVMTGCSVEQSSITAGSRPAGGLVGYAAQPLTLSDCAILDSKIYYLNGTSSSYPKSGVVIGRQNTNCTLTLADVSSVGNTIYYPNDVTDTNPSVSGWSNAATTSGELIVTPPSPVAQIGDKTYASLAEALLAAETGATIEILDGTWGADAIGSLTIQEKLSIRTKSLTIQAAEDAAPKFTADVFLGYDDSKTVNATMTVKGLAFENAKLSIGEYVSVTVEGCFFTGSGENAALAIIDSCVKNHLTTDVYPAAQVTVRNCTFDGTKTSSPAIRIRNGGNVTITGNTVANSNHNGILIESNGSLDNTPTKTVSITGNTITEWNAENVSGAVKNRGGRAIRLALGTLAEGSTVTVGGNTFRKDAAGLGLDEPDFVKISDAGSASVDISGNDWNDMLLSDVAGNAAVYTCDAAATAIDSVVTNTPPSQRRLRRLRMARRSRFWRM